MPPTEIMKNKDNSPIKNGRKERPLISPAFSAAWSKVLGLVLLTLSAVPSHAAKTKAPNYSPDLAAWVAASPNGMVTVNVQYRNYPTKGYLKNRQSGGAYVRWQLPSISAVTMTVPVTMIPTLESEANVIYISPDRPLIQFSNPVTEEFATAIQADVAASQYALNGSGVGVAVIDSGIASHSDLNNS